MKQPLILTTFAALFLLAAGTAVSVRADTPTPSPSGTPTETGTCTPTVTGTATPTATQTATPTITPGEGYFGVNVLNGLGQPIATPFLVPGTSGNELQISYTTSVQFTGGSLTIVFPADLPTPCAANFSVIPVPGQEALLQTTPTFDGVTVTVGLNSNFGPNSALSTVIFNYGVNSTGLLFPAAYPTPTTLTSESFEIWVNPLSTTTGPGGLVPPPPPIPVYSATTTPTVTQSFTSSPTETPSPNWTATVSSTPTVSPTITSTPTVTAVGPAPQTGFYTYPNPFDKHQQSYVTIRFPPTGDAVTITIFNLLGNPVRKVPASDVQAGNGVAVWTGEDDYGRQVPGGLYFVRLKSGSTVTVHKMTVFQ
jgi:hypothetical protein